MPDYSFDAADADIVLRSGDAQPVHFKVHRCILAVASPFFSTMFTLPQAHPSHAPAADLPTVDVVEEAALLDKLLRFVYPVPDPDVPTLDELLTLLTVAIKYDLTSVVSRLRGVLVSPHFLASAPMRVFAIASRFDLEDEVRIASQHTLHINVLDSPSCDDLGQISAYAYHRLLDLHRRRATAAELLLRIPDEIKCTQCHGHLYHSFAPPRWWSRFRERGWEELRARPTTKTIFSFKFLMEAAKASGCPRCAGSILDSYAFLETLKGKIDALPATV